jgi:hypothetical protein
MSKTITFRGQLDSGGMDEINLKTNTGKKGYKITKFETMPDTPGTNQTESIVKIYNKTQSSVDALIDFTESDLMAARFQAIANGSNEAYATAVETIFDNTVVNQNIFVTAIELAGGRPTNYYIELESMTLSDVQSTQLTLKSLRNVASRT